MNPPARTSPPAPSSPVDTHAHVFVRGLALAEERRYAPAGEAPLRDYLALLDAHGVAAGVLVQPSFLGTDNRHLVESLATAPARLRGIAVVDPGVTDGELAALGAAGVVGIRFNLVGGAGGDPARLARPAWRALAARVAARGWQLELHLEGRHLPAALDALDGLDAPIVVDHFGRPDPALGAGDPGFRRLLAEGPRGRIRVKLSGAYRCGGADVRPYLDALLAAIGPERLLWGSDWPFTQHEGERTYARCVAELEGWCDASTRARIAAESRRLFRLP